MTGASAAAPGRPKQGSTPSGGSAVREATSVGAHTQTDALIVGAGPVGLFQVFQLGLLNIPCHVIDALPHPGGQCAELYPDKPIYDIPGIPATTGRDLVASLMAQIAPFTRNGTALIHCGQQVNSVQRQDDGRYRVETTANQTFLAKTVFLAAGAGAFVPRKLRVEGLAPFEGSQLFYQVPEALDVTGKHVTVQGDDDTALGWAIDHASQIMRSDLAAPASVTLIHRRDVFTAAPALVAQMNMLREAGHLRFMASQITAPATIPSSGGGTLLHGLQLALADGSHHTLRTDLLLASLGLSPRLGPLAEWGLLLQRKQVPVDTQTFQTALPGIFAVGDINTYPGKKKLIVCGFHECVLAAFGAAERVFPGQPQLLQYTTTSTRLHALLGVEGR